MTLKTVVLHGIVADSEDGKGGWGEVLVSLRMDWSVTFSQHVRLSDELSRESSARVKKASGCCLSE